MSMETLEATGVAWHKPGEAELRQYPFISSHTTVDRRNNASRLYVSHIKRLPCDSLVMGCEESADIGMLLTDEKAMVEAGYSQPRKRYNNTYSEDSYDRTMSSLAAAPLLTHEGSYVLGRAIMAGQQAVFMPELAVEGKDVITQTATAAWLHLVEANRAWSHKLARKRTAIPLNDAQQEADIGLMHAASTYDYRKGFKFSTFACNWINQSLDRAMGASNFSLPVPDLVRLAFSRAYRIEAEYGPLHELPIEKAAEYLRITPDEASDIMAYRQNALGHVSLNLQLDDSEKEIQDFVAGEDGGEIAERIDNSELARSIASAIGRLPDFHRIVFEELTAKAVYGGIPEKVSKLAASLGVKTWLVNAATKEAKEMLMHPSLGLVAHTAEGSEFADLERAFCKDEAVETFFIDPSEEAAETRAILCGSCAVKSQCEAFATENDVAYGHWGDISKDFSILAFRNSEAA
ncbi:hypothetical protein BH10PAT3_BH10PAT3_0440 [soil metagenome]